MLQPYLNQVQERVLVDGGFSDRLHGVYRPDATAWAILVLHAKTSELQILNIARSRLIDDQLSDGRVTISPHHTEAFWPTPLAVLAWHGSPNHQGAKERALRFLLKVSGLHWENDDSDVVGHDTLIPGWPWIGDTHSWVAPTAMAISALTVAGLGSHSRVDQGVRMILDRQLLQGGWNYGNTTVLGKELRPFPETTGMALNAVAGRVPTARVEMSLDYLLGQVPKLRTPLSLGWAVLGLKAWDIAPDDCLDWIMETLECASRYGGYDTSSLCLLIVAAFASQGLESAIIEPQTENTPS